MQALVGGRRHTLNCWVLQQIISHPGYSWTDFKYWDLSEWCFWCSKVWIEGQVLYRSPKKQCLESFFPCWGEWENVEFAGAKILSHKCLGALLCSAVCRTDQHAQQRMKKMGQGSVLHLSNCAPKMEPYHLWGLDAKGLGWSLTTCAKGFAEQAVGCPLLRLAVQEWCAWAAGDCVSSHFLTTLIPRKVKEWWESLQF